MSKGKGLFARRILAAALAISSIVTPMVGRAQTPAPPQQPVRGPLPSGGQVPPLNRTIPTRSVGLDPGRVVNWTLRDAILAALEKNVDIEIERDNVRLAGYDIDSAKGVYDPFLSSTITYNPSKQPNAFIFSGTAQDFIKRDTFTYNFGLQQFVEKGGGEYAITFNNNRVISNVNNFTPQYGPNLTFNYTQPLFKNFKIDNNRRQIKIAKKRLDLSDATFRQRAIEIISRVQQAYWDLALAIRDEDIQRDAVKLAEAQLSNTQRQVEVGTLAQIDIVNTAAVLEGRRQNVYQAMNAVAIAENTLKSLTVESPTADLWNAQIVPVERFEIQDLKLPLSDALKLAIDNRPEMKQFHLQKEINDYDVDFFKNQTKPQIDLVGGYTMIGLSGSPRIGTNPEERFIGGYGNALGIMFGNDFRQWQVGVQFNFPLRNRTAEANYGRALETGRQLDLRTRKQMQDIEVEVRNAIQAVETARLRNDAARAARIYAEQQLEGENKRFAAGYSTTFLILTRQNELATARGVELRAAGDYNKSVAELQRVISTTLSSNNIEVKSDVPTK